MSQRSIAIKLGKDPAAISRTLKLLESGGLIELTAVNGCKNGVSLTEKFFSLRPRLNEIINRVTKEYCEGLTEDEITHGLIFLQKIVGQRD